ncbi:MAG: prepilin-type N-terminal cleavage/methylation domain-containing protein [Nitrospira sp.]|nr:prepilin-type N-terminal cleavage/methylation domain-containing protein [Nitrospira sp.]
MNLFLSKKNIFNDDCSSFGFTLIEVLVSVTILSVVLAAIYGTFFLSHRAIEGMDESMTKLQESRRALDVLKRELDSAVFIPDPNSGKNEKTFFRMQDRDVYGKQASQLTFTAFSVPRPGLSKIAYYIEEKDRKLYLYKKVASPFGKQETEGAEIIEDLEDFAIEAKYSDKWVKIWDTDINKGMPEELRISLSMMIKGKKVTLSDVSKPMYDKHV